MVCNSFSLGVLNILRGKKKIKYGKKQKYVYSKLFCLICDL